MAILVGEWVSKWVSEQASEHVCGCLYEHKVRERKQDKKDFDNMTIWWLRKSKVHQNQA